MANIFKRRLAKLESWLACPRARLVKKQEEAFDALSDSERASFKKFLKKDASTWRTAQLTLQQRMVMNVAA